jgi:dTDP-4-dehydrorhamnose 3,5-epimerase
MEEVKIIKNVHSAIAMAVGKKIPVLTPVKTYLDTRSLSFMNILCGDLPPRGQINYSKVFPGAVKAWHRHKKQIDFWICVDGDLKVGLYCAESDTMSIAHIGEHSPSMVVIPPGVWHGCTPIGGKPAGLLYCVSEKYDPMIPDEERSPWDSMRFDWGIKHG